MLILGNKENIHLKLKKVFDKVYQKKYEIVRNEYGKPYLKSNNLYFNISHSDDLSVAVIEKYECGIDVEKTRKYNELMAAKICTEAEYDFLNQSNEKDYCFTALWVLKEAYLKCLGTGIVESMSKISFIKNNRFLLDIGEYKIKLLNHGDYIIAICRKSSSYGCSNS